MKVNEIFTSFQGEGAFIGTPATFLRLSDCNLNCKFCDTDFTFSEEIAIEEVKKRLIKQIKENNVKLLVITGGEPLLQSEELEKLINILPNNITIQIESNGSIFYYNENIKYVISPKENKKEVFDKWCKYKNVYFKFLISSKEDIEEFINIKKNYNNTIWLQPEFSKANEVTDLIIANLNKLDNIKISVQSHKYLGQR